MESQKKKRGNLKLIWHFLKGAAWMFAIAIAGSVLNIIFNAAIPQVIRYGVDAVVEGGEQTVPFLGVMDVRAFLPVAALCIVVCSAISGLGSYLARVYTARGSETFLKDMRDTDVYKRQVPATAASESVRIIFRRAA